MNILVVCKPFMGSERRGDHNDQHEACVQEICNILGGVVKHHITRDIDSEVNPDKYEVVVTVGGDGTLLHASHFIGPDIPVLAINSAPDHSEGYFCGSSRTHRRLKECLLEWDKLERTKVTRMSVNVSHLVDCRWTNYGPLTKRGLNDALFCHDNPAMTSRYEFMTTSLGPENQRSSGVLFSTAVGSTASMRSAGGFTSPHDNENLQYLVREPFQPAGNRLNLVHGFLRPGEIGTVYSSMDSGRVYVDGSHVTAPVPQGSKLVVRKSNEPLTLLNFRTPDRY